MGEQKSGISFLLYDILFLVVFIGLITTVFQFSGLFLIAQVVLSAVFIAFSFLGLVAITNNLRWGYTILFITMALVLLDTLWLYARIGRRMDIILFLTLIVGAIGFIVALANMRKAGPEEIPAVEPVDVEKVEAPKAPLAAAKKPGRRGRPRKKR